MRNVRAVTGQKVWPTRQLNLCRRNTHPSSLRWVQGLTGWEQLTNQSEMATALWVAIRHSFLVITKRKTRVWVGRVSKPKRSKRKKRVTEGKSTVGSSGKDFISFSWPWNTLTPFTPLNNSANQVVFLQNGVSLSYVLPRSNATIAFTFLVCIRIYHGLAGGGGAGGTK